MSSILSVIEQFREQLHEHPERAAAIIADAVLHVTNLNAQDLAIAHAYAICGRCTRVYTEAQWVWLKPTPGKKWKNDALELEEHRDCEVCGKEMVRSEFLKSPRQADAIPLDRVAHLDERCGACGHVVRTGDIYTGRVDRKSGHRLRGVWCSKDCERGSP